MIKFIVVDDDLEIQKKVKKIITKATFDYTDEINIEFFTHYSEELRTEIKNTDIKKVYLLDIELRTGISGIEIADKIRRIDNNSEIIFITSHDKMFETAYRNTYNIFKFLEKFHEFDKKLEATINKVLKIGFDNKVFYYKSRNVNLTIYLKNILYIYRDTSDRKLIIYTNSNEYTISMSLQEAYEKLDSRFAYSHRASIVNLDQIEECNWKEKEIKFKDGSKSTYLSKRYKKEIIKS